MDTTWHKSADTSFAEKLGDGHLRETFNEKYIYIYMYRTCPYINRQYYPYLMWIKGANNMNVMKVCH